MLFITCYWEKQDGTMFSWYFAVEDGNAPAIGDTVMLPVKAKIEGEEFDEQCVDGLVVSRRWCFTYDEDGELETTLRLEVKPDVIDDLYVPDNGEEEDGVEEAESA